MSFLLGLIPAPYRLLAELALVAAVAAAVWGWIHHGKDVAHTQGLAEGRAEIQAKWDADVSAQRLADAKETQRRLERQGDAQREQAQELARYQRAAADAVVARDGMRQLVDDLEAVAQHGSSDTATADERKAGTAAAGMLADVSRAADDEAEVYARAADESRRAGLLCERSYDALTQTQ